MKHPVGSLQIRSNNKMSIGSEWNYFVRKGRANNDKIYGRGEIIKGTCANQFL